jgi:hypothetical protein
MKEVQSEIWGVMAEFTSAAELFAATRRAKAAGYRHIDAYSPFGIEPVAAELGLRKTAVPLLTLLGGLSGTIGGFLLQYWVSAINYPINAGGKPLNSWVAFVIVCFELTILGASLGAFIGMLALNGLPEPYHPVFHAPRFAAVTRDSFFLVIESRDPKFELHDTFRFLQTLNPREVTEVPN